MSKCGHSICKNCVEFRLLAVEEGKQCPECGEVTPNEMIRPNKKVLAIMEITAQEQEPEVEEEELNNKLELASVKS